MPSLRGRRDGDSAMVGTQRAAVAKVDPGGQGGAAVCEIQREVESFHITPRQMPLTMSLCIPNALSPKWPGRWGVRILRDLCCWQRK